MGTGSSIADSRPDSGSTYVYNNPRASQGATPSRRLVSAITEEEEEGAMMSPSPAQEDLLPLTESQKRDVLLTLSNLEKDLNITFNHTAIVNTAKIMQLGPQEVLLSAGSPPRGVFMVEEGVLQVLSPSGGVILAHLMKGDFCGELSVLQNQACSATIRSESKYVCHWSVALPYVQIARSAVGNLVTDCLGILYM